MNYMDNRYFLCIRKGVRFYYFGEGCIADYMSKSIAYLDDLDIALIQMCDGSRSTIECVNQLKIGTTVEEIRKRIERLKCKGVIVIRDKISKSMPIFYGVKGLYYPKDISIELTTCCNFRCNFCYKDAGNNGSYISDSVIQNVVDLVGGKVELVTLTGGEPTLHSHWLKYVDQFTEKNTRISMITNGSQLFKFHEHVSTIRKIDFIQFSMYGRNDEEYELTTGIKKGFTNLQNSIDLARRCGVGVHLALTLSEETIHNLEDYVEVAQKVSPDILNIGFADNYGRGEKMFTDEYVKNIRIATEQIALLRRKYNGRLKIFAGYEDKLHGYKSKNDDVVQKVYRGSLACGSGSESLVISSSGRIRPCHFFPEDIFSIPSEEALREHIYGNFHQEHLSQAIDKYIDLRKNTYNPCVGMCEMKRI